MAPYNILLALIWLVFIVVWGIGALRAKRTLKGSWMRLWWLRIVALLVIVAVAHFAGAGGYSASVVRSPALNLLGVILAALGVGLAVWARLHLGRNWGMPMALKEAPELVTTGPYAYIRNPIYSGMLLAIAGSVCLNWWWTFILIFAGIYFISAAKNEEKIMLEEFPGTYPAYKARTKMLIPFVL